MNFQKTIRNLYEKESIDSNTFLLVAWYGRSFYEGVGSKLKIWKELIVANIGRAQYHSSLWENSQVFKIAIPEVEIVSIRLGSIYDSKGKLVLDPLNSLDKSYGLYTSRLKLTKNIDVLRTGLYNLFSSSVFPYYKASNATELERVYNKAPYYLFSKDATDYILPIHVVNSFFYYKNSRCVHHITFNNIINIFEKSYLVDNEIVVPYHGSIIESEDAKFFSKFLFLVCDNGINCLKKIPMELLSDSMNSNSNNRAYMLGGFPLQEDADFKVVGQYITNSREGGRNKFLVYGITEFKWVQPLFKIEKYTLFNLEDRRSTDSDRPEYEKAYSGIQAKEIRRGKQTYAGGAVNSSIPIKKDSYHSTFFDESPSIQFLDREDQVDFYKRVGTVLQEIESYSKNYNDTYSKSKIGRSNTEILIETNEYFKLFKDVISEIANIDNYTTDIFEIKTDQIVNKETLLPIILCAFVKYKGYHYYLLDYGFGTAIPVFRYCDGTISMTYDDIENVIMNTHNLDLSWGKIYNEQKLLMRYALEGVHMLAPLNHPSGKKILCGEGVDSLKSRICENIFRDRNSRK